MTTIRKGEISLGRPAGLSEYNITGIFIPDIRRD
jgi:hypothetical protein